ncbi:hypothetical protein DS2_08570 [Catenovulum agarivorans DS-2]|uniref:Alginate export domain-containing protein n=1 Tax=Catenovulum agarivorans DS-2 TaxID=1328313 RepID=W7QBT4_9ALTE|nr:hypothetical protein [Catenovulum agarivorans]EWH10314.1 hypothetical protein DS2_08570 [Catenovulum agarivorans DS-2]
MLRLNKICAAVVMAASSCAVNGVIAQESVDFELRGYFGAEGRYYAEHAHDPMQSDSQFSVTAEPDLYWQWPDGNNSFTFKPYLRLDSQDSERTHFDIREAMWLHIERDWEMRLGIGKVFWGVTETVHLVDIVNQTDTVEAFDGEEKLGQPMLQLTFLKDWGIVDAFVLPGFRERTFPGKEGRLRGNFVIDTNNAQYESSDKTGHIDFALNWRNTYDDLDISLNWFNGTSREPVLRPEMNPQGGLTGELVPFYPQINQFGAVAQYIYLDWIWKLEAINRAGDKIDDYNAMVGGFEYTFVGVFGSFSDLGIVAEYSWDERGTDASVPAQNDVSLAARVVLNDISSTEILAGWTQDLDYSDSRSLFVEASTRVGDSTKVTLDMWLFNSEDSRDLGYGFSHEDFIQLAVEWYY